jgi:hypothetical protein
MAHSSVICSLEDFGLSVDGAMVAETGEGWVGLMATVVVIAGSSGHQDVVPRIPGTTQEESSCQEARP